MYKRNFRKRTEVDQPVQEPLTNLENEVSQRPKRTPRKSENEQSEAKVNLSTSIRSSVDRSRREKEIETSTSNLSSRLTRAENRKPGPKSKVRSSPAKRTRKSSGSESDNTFSPKRSSKRQNRDSISSEDELEGSDLDLAAPLANSTQKSNRQLKLPRSTIKPYFEEVLLLCGFRLRSGDEQHYLVRDQASFVFKFESEIEKNGRGVKNVDDFIQGFQKYISSQVNLKKSLDVTESDSSCETARKSQASLIRLLLTVSCMQCQVMVLLFEIIADKICSNDHHDNSSFVLVQNILRQLRFLDCLKDSAYVCNELLNLIELAESEDIKREVILFLPDIIGDAQHENAALSLSEMLSANPSVIPAILDALENLIISPDLRDVVITKVLHILDHAPIEHQRNVIKFLTTVATDMDTVIREIRKNINLDVGLSSQRNRSCNDGSEWVIFATNLKDAALNSKVLVDTWLEIITSVDKTILLPVDLVALLVFHENCLCRKKVEIVNTLKHHALLGLEADKAINSALPRILSVIDIYLDTTLAIASSLLRDKDQSICEHSTIWFSLLLEHSKGSRCQKVINELLALVGSGTPTQASLTLNILWDAGKKNILSLAPYAHQLIVLLDKIDQWDLDIVRQVLKLLCLMAYKCDAAFFLQDEINMMVRKQISSSLLSKHLRRFDPRTFDPECKGKKSYELKLSKSY